MGNALSEVGNRASPASSALGRLFKRTLCDAQQIIRGSRSSANALEDRFLAIGGCSAVDDVFALQRFAAIS
jgi:hypothetical protein